MKIQIIGLDMATDPKNVGLAYATYDDGTTRLTKLARGAAPLQHQVGSLIDPELPVLLAMDSPLGWPEPLAQGLHNHIAGRALPGHPNHLFRRETDRFIKERVNKQSLDVGADRIARTALAALQLLDDLRREYQQFIELAWDPYTVSGWSAIEVYPAATLKSRGWPDKGYKRKEQSPQRQHLVDLLGRALKLEVATEPMIASDDVLDAALCVLAAQDFLRGEAMEPPASRRVRIEGWIWTRDPVRAGN